MQIGFRGIRRSYFYSHQSKKLRCNRLLQCFLMKLWVKRTSIETEKLFGLSICSQNKNIQWIFWLKGRSVARVCRVVRGVQAGYNPVSRLLDYRLSIYEVIFLGLVHEQILLSLYSCCFQQNLCRVRHVLVSSHWV
jgi:hypothetical protein